MVIKNNTRTGLFLLDFRERYIITPYNEYSYYRKMSNSSAYSHATTEDILRYIVNFVKR